MASASPSVSPSASPSPSASASVSPSISPSASASVSPSTSPSVSPSVSPSYGAPTFTEGNECYFLQIADRLYITNGVDDLVYYDGSDLIKYTELNAPDNPGASIVGGLSSGVYTYYGEATALNDVGETVGSSEASIAVNKTRDNWTAGTDSVMWYWDSVSGATSYQLYINDQSGTEKLLTGTPETFFEDTGTKALNPYVETPSDNTTSGPHFKSMALSGNRIWATNDTDNPYYVYWSGTGSDMGKFSEFYGGGWIALERGGRQRPTAVAHYQTGSGDGAITVFCRTPEGRGAIWQISLETLTIGETQFSVPSATKVIGSFGTNAIRGVVATTNDILFPNKRGIYSLGPEKNFYGVLRTNELSTKIRSYWRGLSGAGLDNIACYFYDSKLFISVPTSGTTNNRTIIYDLERLNWAVDWSIGAKQFIEYTDTNGVSHLLFRNSSSNYMMELSEDISGDLGQAFNTSYVSGRIPLSKLWKDFVKINKVYFKIGSPKGTINFDISGSQRNTPFSSLKSGTLSSSLLTANTGMGWDKMGTVQMGDTEGSPDTFADSSDARYIKVRKKLRDIQFQITSNSYDTEYTLQGIIAEGNLIRVNPPSDWKLTT